MISPVPHREPPASVRLDRWLFAARLFKTRGAATQAVNAGKVKFNGEAAKAHRPIHVGDRVFLKRDGRGHTYTVKALVERRVGAKEAAELYELAVDLELTPEIREMVQLYRQIDAQVPRSRGRPSKRDRRQISKLKQGEED